MASGDVYKAAINTVVNGVNCLNVMHFEQQDDDGSEVPADSLKAGLETIVLPTWVPMLSNNAAVASVVLKRILPTVDQPYVYSFSGGTGTVAQEAEPPNLVVCNTIYTNEPSRRGRGRQYFSGVAQTLIQGAVPKASFVSLFSTFWTALFGPFIDGGSAIHWQLVHYSPTDAVVRAITHHEQRMQLRLIRNRIKN